MYLFCLNILYHRDANGNVVGYGHGDLNGEERGLVVRGTDLEVVREALSKIDDINKVGSHDEAGTLLDAVYEYNDSPIHQEIIDLIRSKGGN